MARLGCGVDLAWITAIMCTMRPGYEEDFIKQRFRLFPEQPRMLLVLKASCRDGPLEGTMIGFLSENRVIALDVGDAQSATILEVHQQIHSARLARDWRAPQPFAACR